MKLRHPMRGWKARSAAIAAAALACALAPGLRADEAPAAKSAPAEAKPAPDLEALIAALKLLKDDPQALEKMLGEALADAAAKKGAAQKEIEAIDARVKALEEARALLDQLARPAPAAEAKPAMKAEPPAPPAPAAAAPPPAEKPEPAAPAEPPPAAAVSGRELSPEAKEKFLARFEAEIWPLMKQGAESCFSCHGPGTKTPLELSPEPRVAFAKLAQEHYFDAEYPHAIVSKITSPHEKSRMPPAPHAPWAEDQIALVRAFSKDLADAQGGRDLHADERFPEYLLAAYDGEAGAKGEDNTFLTYYQLRRKIAAIFGEAWTRNERDRFQENITLFSGADFQVRYSESAEASAAYLAGLDLLAADVASNAYLNATGPFRGRPEDLRPAAELDAPDAAYAEAIGQLYRRILFRDPTPEESARSFALVKSIEASAREDAGRPVTTLDFDLVITGDAGISTTRSFQIEVMNAPVGLYQEAVDLEVPAPSTWPLKKRIGTEFHFKKGDRNQSAQLSNAATRGAVPFAAFEIVGPLPFRFKKELRYDSPGVLLEGPWNFRKAGNMPFVDDGDENKGECSVTAAIDVPADGRYEVWLKWPAAPIRKRKNALLEKADAVTVEVYSHDETRLASPALPPPPPPGEARFTLDQTPDNVAFWDLKSAFRFESEEHYVEINNAGTRKRVTADAIRFEPAGGGAATIMDDDKADGREDWPVFKDYPFRPYNITGADAVSDKNERKGEIALRYRPTKLEGWDKAGFFRVGVGFPGQVNNETQVPVIVRAAASSPVARLAAPRRAPVGTTVQVSAGTSYDLQGSALKFEWRQVGGPRVAMADARSATTTLTLGPAPPEQLAWEGLARALVRHPDFVFTRPPSLASAPDPEARRALLLVKIAQDLVGRPPLPSEVALAYRGDGISGLIDRYLASKEFEDFYFHRIRLYLESHGTEEEDEPVRLWSYIAFNDRPFKELLTADYTVDAAMKKAARPAHHGRTGVLTTLGFMKGKPGLPHFNYSAQVAEKFLGYVFEVPPEIVEQREGITATATTAPETVCYNCHKVLTPLAYQRLNWDDAGRFREHDDQGRPIDASDRGIVASYPFKGAGLEAFAASASEKERFIRTVINTHFTFFFGRSIRWQEDERGLYRRLWQAARESDYSIKGVIKAILTSPEYLGSPPPAGERKERLYASP